MAVERLLHRGGFKRRIRSLSSSARRAAAIEIQDGLRWQVFTILESCAEKTREVEALIWRVDPDTAEIYLGGTEHR